MPDYRDMYDKLIAGVAAATAILNLALEECDKAEAGVKEVWEEELKSEQAQE